MAGEFDLKIVAGDLVFGPDDEPLFLSEADAVAQDIKHRLDESGLTEELIGEDSPAGTVNKRIAFAVEEDLRISPGTAAAAESAPGTIHITAQTLDGTTITTTVNV